MYLGTEVSSDHARAGFTVSQGVLIVPVQVELYDDVLKALHDDALNIIQQRGLHALLLDLSHVQVIDYEIMRQLVQLIDMVKLLGVKSIVAGLQPAVVVAMVEWAELCSDIETASNLDSALQILHAT